MTPDKIERYRNGDCGMLALAVRKLTGWPVIEGGIAHINLHYQNRLPDGRYLDATGVHEGGWYPTPEHDAAWFREEDPEWTDDPYLRESVHLYHHEPGCECCADWDNPEVLADAAVLLSQINQKNGDTP